MLISALNIISTGVSEDIQMIPHDKSQSNVEKDHIAMAETNNAVLKSKSTVTVDLTEGSSTDSPLAKKLKTFDMEKLLWGTSY